MMFLGSIPPVSYTHLDVYKRQTLFGEDGLGNRISGLEIGHLMGETRLAMFTHITQRVARIYHRCSARSDG